MLQEAEAGLTNMAMSGAQGRYQGDEFLLVRFFIHARINNSKSAEAGRPIYEDTDYVSIMQPGNKDSIIIRPASALDKNRFAEHWRKYQARQGDEEETLIGTPLAEWPGCTRAQCEELRYFNVRTVEQLAQMNDSNGQNIMGINMLKDRAVKYLAKSRDSETANALAAANARIDELMALVSKGVDVPRETDEPKRRRKTAE